MEILRTAMLVPTYTTVFGSPNVASPVSYLTAFSDFSVNREFDVRPEGKTFNASNCAKDIITVKNKLTTVTILEMGTPGSAYE